MHRLFRRLTIATIATIVGGIAGGFSVYLFLGVLRGLLIDDPLDLTNSINWLTWILSIGIGIGGLIVGLYLGQSRWKLILEKGEPFQVLVRVSAMGALIGIGVILSWSSLSQMGLALLVAHIQGAPVP